MSQVIIKKDGTIQVLPKLPVLLQKDDLIRKYQQ